MGLSTATVFGLLFLAGITAIIHIINIQSDYYINFGMEEEKAFKNIFKKVHSDITIEDVSYSGGELTIVVNNTGNTVLNPKFVYLMINDTWMPEEKYTVSLLKPSVRGFWKPEESIIITCKTTLSSPVTVKVVAETGVEDRYEYRL